MAAAGVLFAPLQLDSYDAGIMAQVGHNLLASHSVRVTSDPFHLNYPYASYGIGMSLLMASAYWVAEHTGRAAVSLIMLINPLVVALTAVAILLWGWAASATPRQAVVTALLTVFATPLLAYTATAFAEPGVALGVATGLLGLQLIRRGRRTLGCLVAGLGAGIAVLMRPDSLLLVAPILGLAAAALCGRRAMLSAWFLAGIAPSLLVTGLYNYVRFGSAFVSQYLGMTAGQAFNHPILSGLYGLALSPARGLLLYAPIVLLAAVCLPWAWRRSRLMTLTVVCLIAVRILFYAPWFSWEAGVSWGPRFLVPAMPVLAPLLLEAVRRWPRLPNLGRALFAGLVAVSLAIQVVGAAEIPGGERLWLAMNRAQIDYGPDFSRFIPVRTSPRTEAIIDGYLFDWQYFPLYDSAQQLLAGRNLAGRYLQPPPHRRAVALLLAAVATGLLASLLGTRPGRSDSGPTRLDVGLRRSGRKRKEAGT